MTTALVRTVNSPDRLSAHQRLELVKADPMTMSVVAQRVADGDTLKEIAIDWQVPHGLFQLWVGASKDRMEVYESALKMRADAEIHNALKIANTEFITGPDGNFILDARGAPIPKDVKWARLQVATSFKVAEKWNPDRFVAGAEKQGKKGETSEDGIAMLARKLAGALQAGKNMPGSIDKTPIDVEDIRI